MPADTPNAANQHKPDYLVSWQINDTSSANPQSAARNALATLNDARLDDSESSNVFTVFDRVTDTVHEVDLGDVSGNADYSIAIWPRPDDTGIENTLSHTDAHNLAYKTPTVTRVRIKQSEYLKGHAAYLHKNTAEADHFSYLHQLAYSFGAPYECHAEIVAVDGPYFLVDYVTNLGPFKPVST